MTSASVPDEPTSIERVFTVYERAILESFETGDKRVLRVMPVDGAAVLDEDGVSLPCWNGLSAEQQEGLIRGGGRVRRAEAVSGCPFPAKVLIEAPLDEDAPGPRMYCYGCAVDRAKRLATGWT